MDRHHRTWRIIPRTHLIELGTSFPACRILSTQGAYEFCGYRESGLIELSWYGPETRRGTGQIGKVERFGSGAGTGKS